MPRTPVKAARSMMVPSVAFKGVKEWPVPGTRTGPGACRMAAASSTSSLGAMMACGLQTTPPDQFDHLPATIFMRLLPTGRPRLCTGRSFKVNIDRRNLGRNAMHAYRDIVVEKPEAH